MRIKYKLKFFPYSRQGYKLASVRMRLSIHKEKPVDFATGYFVDPEDWDTTSQTVRPIAPDAAEINETISTWRSAAEDMMSRYALVDRRYPTREEAKDLFNDLIGRKPMYPWIGNSGAPPLAEALAAFIKEEGEANSWTETTRQKFVNLGKLIAKIDPKLSLATITDARLQSFVSGLAAHGMRNSTAAKTVALFRWFLRWAYAKGWYDGRSHETFRPKLKGSAGNHSEIVYLTADELRAVETHEFTPKQAPLARARDVFVFCCYTGLRYSDAAKLRREDIRDGFITVTTKKTGKALTIELNAHSRAVLDRYAFTGVMGKGRALPVVSNAGYNVRLKEIGQLCGLDAPVTRIYWRGRDRIEETCPKWQALTTHVARRTFVVMALRLGIPAEVVMRWTGHSRYDAMRPYVAIVDEVKKSAMSRFDTLWDVPHNAKI